MWWSSVNEGQVLFLKGRSSSGSSVQNHYDFWELKSCTPQERHHRVWILSRVQFRFNSVAQVCKRSQLGGFQGVAMATGWEFPWDYPQLEYCCARARVLVFTSHLTKGGPLVISLFAGGKTYYNWKGTFWSQSSSWLKVWGIHLKTTLIILPRPNVSPKGKTIQCSLVYL